MMKISYFIGSICSLFLIIFLSCHKTLFTKKTINDLDCDVRLINYLKKDWINSGYPECHPLDSMSISMATNNKLCFLNLEYSKVEQLLGVPYSLNARSISYLLSTNCKFYKEQQKLFLVFSFNENSKKILDVEIVGSKSIQ
jgi:hypothetical protein